MTTDAQAPSTPAEVLAAASRLIGGLDELMWAARRPEEMLDAKAAVEQVRSQLYAVNAELAREIEATQAAKADGWASAGVYLTQVSGGRQGSGNALLRVGRALTDDLGLTLDALRSGRVSPEHAEVIVATIDMLPVKRSLRLQGEAAMLEQARTLNATDLKAAGKHLVELLDPEGSDRREERALARGERAAHQSRHLTIVDDGMGGVRVKGRGTVEDAAVIKAALSPLAAPRPSTDADCGVTGMDPRDHPTRMWDALTEACQQVLDSQTLPECHGEKPRVSVTMRLADLLEGVGTGTLETGERLSVWAVRKLACDADITPVVLGRESEILDVGRTQRLVTAAIWKALVVRDRCCTFPGCTRPPIACDAHHVRHWLDGGPTALDNLALLCGAHHTMIHTTPWEIRLNPVDKRPEFLAPARVNPDRTWIRERNLRQ